jgi:hypothetical protein
MPHYSVPTTAPSISPEPFTPPHTAPPNIGIPVEPPVGSGGVIGKALPWLKDMAKVSNPIAYIIITILGILIPLIIKWFQNKAEERREDAKTTGPSFIDRLLGGVKDAQGFVDKWRGKMIGETLKLYDPNDPSMGGRLTMPGAVGSILPKGYNATSSNRMGLGVDTRVGAGVTYGDVFGNIRTNMADTLTQGQMGILPGMGVMQGTMPWVNPQYAKYATSTVHPGMPSFDYKPQLAPINGGYYDFDVFRGGQRAFGSSERSSIGEVGVAVSIDIGDGQTEQQVINIVNQAIRQAFSERRRSGALDSAVGSPRGM